MFKVLKNKTVLFLKHFPDLHCYIFNGNRNRLQHTFKDVTSGARGSLPRAPKSPNSVASTLVNTVHLLPKDLRFEHGGRQACF